MDSPSYGSVRQFHLARGDLLMHVTKEQRRVKVGVLARQTRQMNVWYLALDAYHTKQRKITALVEAPVACTEARRQH